MTYGASPIAAWAAAACPPPQLTVSGWAAIHRVLPEASAARGGRWSNAATPALVGIMDSVLEPGVRQVTIQKAAQVGASEALNNIIAYLISYAPCPMLMLLPTMAAAQAFSKERLSDMVRSTPALRAVVSDKRLPSDAGRPESTLTLKMFPGGFFALGGANSPNSFRRWAARVGIADDSDGFPSTVGEEGDPGRLLVNRTISFTDPLVIFTSTPVLQRGRICSLYRQSDQRRYVIRCPACAREDWMTWIDVGHFHVRFDERTPSTARLECVCGHAIAEPERRALVTKGHWRSTAAPTTAGHVGFHLPALASLFVTMEQLVERFLTWHQEGPMRLKEFITTMLGEGWEDPAERLNPLDLAARAEDF